MLVVCLVCEKQFHLSPRKAKGRKYCSRTCMGIAHRIPPPTKFCKLCGKEFPRPQNARNSWDLRKHCSRACFQEHKAPDLSDRKCEGCGEVYRFEDSKCNTTVWKYRRFCTRSCYLKSVRESGYAKAPM